MNKNFIKLSISLISIFTLIGCGKVNPSNTTTSNQYNIADGEDYNPNNPNSNNVNSNDLPSHNNSVTSEEELFSQVPIISFEHNTTSEEISQNEESTITSEELSETNDTSSKNEVVLPWI